MTWDEGGITRSTSFYPKKVKLDDQKVLLHLHSSHRCARNSTYGPAEGNLPPHDWRPITIWDDKGMMLDV